MCFCNIGRPVTQVQIAYDLIMITEKYRLGGTYNVSLCHAIIQCYDQVLVVITFTRRLCDMLPVIICTSAIACLFLPHARCDS